MRTEVLRVEELTYIENGRKTLNQLNMTLYKGEIMGVFSHHASVKNGLVNLLTGLAQSDSGRLYLDGKPYLYNDTSSLKQQKVAVLHTVNTLIDSLSVSDNIFVIRKGFKQYVIDKFVLQKQAGLLMKEIGLNIDPLSLVFKLSRIDRTLIELVKAYALGAKLIILKDFSSFLSDLDYEQVYSVLHILRTKGVAFLIVDSSADLLEKYTDRVVLIQKGRDMWTFKQGEFNENSLKQHFFNDRKSLLPVESQADQEAAYTSREVLRFEQVETAVLDAVSFSLHSGEALSLFDRDGRGIKAIMELLSGDIQSEKGEIFVKQRPYAVNQPWEALDHGVAFISENPIESMIFKHFTGLENLCFASSRKAPDFWLNPVYLNSCRNEYSQFFEEGSLALYGDQLSMQELFKIIYCRWHLYRPALVVCTKPFNSVDKSLVDISTTFIEHLLKKGIAVLILTSNFYDVGFPCEKMTLTTKESPLSP